MDGIHSKKHELHHVVESEVRKVLRELPPGAFESSELLNYGYIGLLEAEKRFDPTLGTPLDSFARFRIRGAILDGLRNGLGRFGRSHYQRLRREYVAHKRDNGNLDVTADDVTLRDIDRYAETLLKNHPVMPSPSDAEDALAWGQELAVMRQAIDELNTKERRVIRAVYDLSLRDDSGAKLAERLGIHRSQISRKHHAIMARLRAVMRRIRKKTIES